MVYTTAYLVIDFYRSWSGCEPLLSMLTCWVGSVA